MTWIVLVAVVLALGLALLAVLARRADLRRMARSIDERERDAASSTSTGRLQHPVVDLSRCLGCGTCVAACPESNVLALVHGQATVVHGDRCRGHATCEAECPVGAITVTLANLEERRDVPVLSESLEAVGTKNLFLAGEVTAHALIRRAIEQGTAVGREVADRIRSGSRASSPDTLDLCIVGAGPAGLACSLEARRQGLRFVTLDQEETIGGTVAKYPRNKLVVTEPVDLPLYGRLREKTYTKEELVTLWQEIATRNELPIRSGETLLSCQRDARGHFVVESTSGTLRARHVCLALGRRGAPNRLGIPGETLAKVAYNLLDAHSHRGRKILVVGGGDSAVEAAVGLAQQPGNEVTLSYRRERFHRIRPRNEERLQESVSTGQLRVLHESNLVSIGQEDVELTVSNGTTKSMRLDNDEVFVMAGGTPPIQLLERMGVSFDPSLRPQAPELSEQGPGLVRALSIGFLLSLLTLLFALWNADYYGLDSGARHAHPRHEMLRPGMGIGLWLGIAAVALIALNLLYLVRRSPRIPFRTGSLRLWMTSHVATGILAFLCALLHAAMAPGHNVGGHAFWAMTVILLTGAIGRYLYAWVPRAANGRELELAEVKERLASLSREAEGNESAFQQEARREVTLLIERRRWKVSFAGRLLALLGLELDLRRLLARLAAEGSTRGIDPARITLTLAIARRAHRTALVASHFEDLRAILNGWRYLHRWVAVLLVVLVLLHVFTALSYGSFREVAG